MFCGEGIYYSLCSLIDLQNEAKEINDSKLIYLSLVPFSSFIIKHSSLAFIGQYFWVLEIFIVIFCNNTLLLNL